MAILGKSLDFIVLCCSLFPVALTSSIGPQSLVITSQDVEDGTTGLESLIAGELYRVYAVVASNAPIDAYPYPTNIVIKGNPIEYTQFTVAELSIPKPYTAGLLLSDSRILLAPITITDNNPKPPTIDLEGRVPYTIYIVWTTTNLAAPPVLSASYFSGGVDTSITKILDSKCTILSAEPAFQLHSIDADQSDIEVWTAGFDADSSYSVLTATPSNYGSSVYISGPIATLYATRTNAQYFQFNIKKSAPLQELINGGNLMPGASTAILSNGWRSANETYNVDYINHFQDEIAFNFGREIQISFQSYIGELMPDERMQMSCFVLLGSNVYEEVAEYDLTKTPNKTTWCERVELVIFNAQDRNLSNTVMTGPQFMIQIQSGAYSTSSFVLVVASIIMKLLQ